MECYLFFNCSLWVVSLRLYERRAVGAHTQCAGRKNLWPINIWSGTAPDSSFLLHSIASSTRCGRPITRRENKWNRFLEMLFCSLLLFSFVWFFFSCFVWPWLDGCCWWTKRAAPRLRQCGAISEKRPPGSRPLTHASCLFLFPTHPRLFFFLLLLTCIRFLYIYIYYVYFYGAGFVLLFCYYRRHCCSRCCVN